MKKLITQILLFFIFVGPVIAQDTIVINPSSNRKYPIAVPDFTDKKGNSAGEEIVALLKRDLDLAGVFLVLDEKQLVSSGRNPDVIDFPAYSAAGASALIKGVVKGSKSSMVLELRLYDVTSREMLLGKEYTVRKNDFPTAIHLFMDDLMEKLTGRAGPFNSQVVAACGKIGARQIFVMNIDGTGMRAVTKIKGNNFSPAWSPNGSSIAFTSYKSKFPEIYTMSASGGGLRQLTNNRATNLTPAFSPDGNSIVYASSKTDDTEMYLIDTSGHQISQLTKVLNIDMAPAWSPDGSQIVFSSERAGNLHLFLMSASGGGASRLTYTGYQNDQADWSPDGQKIVFTARDRGAFDVFMMNPDGSLIQRITRDEGNNESPSWSPDSRYIVFSSARAGGQGLYVMLADGNNQTLIPDSASCINPDWGPRLK